MDAVDELNLLLGIGPQKAKLPITLTKSGYSAIKPLGKGGFGQAHLVFQQQQKKYFVVKHINLMQLSSRQRKDAHNEIHILQSLHHPNIVRYCEFCEEHPHLYIVMEYADGGDLLGHLEKLKKARQRLSEDQLVSLFAQTCLAVKYLHDKRILHRDIKSGNVFLTKNQVVKLGDFGISTTLQSTAAMAKTMCGTPCYFSPELCQGKLYNSKSDIWALGILLYEMATSGSLPYDGKEMKSLMQAIISKPPPDLPKEHYSKELNDLLQWMLKKDPVDRPDIIQVLKHPAIAKRVPAVTAQLEIFASRPASAVAAPVSASSVPPMIPHPRVANNNNNNNVVPANYGQYLNQQRNAAAVVAPHQQQEPPQPPPRKLPQRQPPADPVSNILNVEKEKQQQQQQIAVEQQQPPKQPPIDNYVAVRVAQAWAEQEKEIQQRKLKEAAEKKTADQNNNQQSNDAGDVNANRGFYDNQHRLYDDMHHVMLDSPPKPVPAGSSSSPQPSNNKSPQPAIAEPSPFSNAGSTAASPSLPFSAAHNNEEPEQLTRVIDELRETTMNETNLRQQAREARKDALTEQEQQQSSSSVVIDVTEPTPSPNKEHRDKEEQKDEKGNTFFEDAQGTSLDVNNLIKQSAAAAVAEENGISLELQQQQQQAKTTATSSSSSSSQNQNLTGKCLCGATSIQVSVADIIGSFVSGDDFSVRSSGNPGGVEYLHLPECTHIDSLTKHQENLRKFVWVPANESSFRSETYFCSICGTRMCIFNLPGARGCCVPRGICSNGASLDNFTMSP